MWTLCTSLTRQTENYYLTFWSESDILKIFKVMIKHYLKQ